MPGLAFSKAAITASNAFFSVSPDQLTKVSSAWTADPDAEVEGESELAFPVSPAQELSPRPRPCRARREAPADGSTPSLCPCREVRDRTRWTPGLPLSNERSGCLLPFPFRRDGWMHPSPVLVERRSVLVAGRRGRPLAPGRGPAAGAETPRV